MLFISVVLKLNIEGETLLVLVLKLEATLGTFGSKLENLKIFPVVSKWGLSVFRRKKKVNSFVGQVIGVNLSSDISLELRQQ